MTARRYTFPRSSRLKSDRLIRAVTTNGIRESRAPLLVQAIVNGLPRCRLALRTGRVVGNAVRRNRIRRLLREAFRLMQHDLPRGYDLLITVRPHEPLLLADYQRLLSAVLLKVHRRLSASATVDSLPVKQLPDTVRGDG